MTPAINKSFFLFLAFYWWGNILGRCTLVHSTRERFVSLSQSGLMNAPIPNPLACKRLVPFLLSVLMHIVLDLVDNSLGSLPSHLRACQHELCYRSRFYSRTCFWRRWIQCNHFVSQSSFPIRDLMYYSGARVLVEVLFISVYRVFVFSYWFILSGFLVAVGRSIFEE